MCDVGSSGFGAIEGRRPLDGLPGLVQLKCTASQRWQVRLIWVKQGGSATMALHKITLLLDPTSEYDCNCISKSVGIWVKLIIPKL